jgi:hypothetical protein
VTKDELLEITAKLQMDARAIQAKLTELRAHIATLDLPAKEHITCPECGLTIRSRPRLAEHLFQTHAGPLPEHWQHAEARAAEPS